jgi:N-acetylglucosaminyl-diphospho-decaprenol L-rhamnosyltransferase
MPLFEDGRTGQHQIDSVLFGFGDDDGHVFAIGRRCGCKFIVDTPRTSLVISVVSHRHGLWLTSALDDLVAHTSSDITIVVTLNVPETVDIDRARYPKRLVWIDNAHPKGFGANHNAALANFDADWYAIVNPDIRLHEDVFQSLIAVAETDEHIGLVVPTVVDCYGHIQDSGRALPTPYRVFTRGFTRWLRKTPPLDTDTKQVWYAGMFMLVRAKPFQSIRGFDERFYLYCEDIDLCARLCLAGYGLLRHPEVSVVHDAQRNSLKSIKHLRWHVESLVHLWMSSSFWRYRKLLASEPPAGTC